MEENGVPSADQAPAAENGPVATAEEQVDKPSLPTKMKKLTEPEIQALIDDLTEDDLEWLKTVTMKPGLLNQDQLNTLLLEGCGPSIEEQDFPLLQQLLELGADLEAVDSEGFTPLFRCVLHNKVDTAEFLLQREAKRDQIYNGKDTCMSKAAELGNDKMVALLMQYSHGRSSGEDGWSGQVAKKIRTMDSLASGSGVAEPDIADKEGMEEEVMDDDMPPLG